MHKEITVLTSRQRRSHKRRCVRALVSGRMSIVDAQKSVICVLGNDQVDPETKERAIILAESVKKSNFNKRNHDSQKILIFDFFQEPTSF